MTAPTPTLELGATAPPFALPEVTNERTVRLDDVSDAPVLLIAFLCKHCPYVVHVQDTFAALAREYQERGVAVIGLCSNDTEVSPDDTPENLAEQKRTVGFTFPYLLDTDQSVAKAYGAACTPDFFAFDADRRLAYRGRMDETRPKSGDTPTGDELRAALDALLDGRPAPAEQVPPMGCSIKWTPGNEPAATG